MRYIQEEGEDLLYTVHCRIFKDHSSFNKEAFVVNLVCRLKRARKAGDTISKSTAHK